MRRLLTLSLLGLCLAVQAEDGWVYRRAKLVVATKKADKPLHLILQTWDECCTTNAFDMGPARMFTLYSHATGTLWVRTCWRNQYGLDGPWSKTLKLRSAPRSTQGLILDP